MITFDNSVRSVKDENRCQTFSANQQIRTRPGLIYYICEGYVRLESDERDCGFATILGKNRPFLVIDGLNAIACTEGTVVSWFYYEHLMDLPCFSQQINAGFAANSCYQLRLLVALSKRHAIDRIKAWFAASIAEFGIEDRHGLCLPFRITHEQIARAIGVNRITVTRLLSILKASGEIAVVNGKVYLPCR